jgi:exonuclease-1
MAFMVREGLADFAISEDADLIAFGCPKLFLKITNYGTGELFEY